MTKKEVIIIGGGPAGLSACKMALASGCQVLLIDRSDKLGGQLIKQTHKFFGSEKQYAKTRGFDIAKKLIADLAPYKDRFEVMLEATVVGLYKDYVVTTFQHGEYRKFKAEAIIVSTGASEKFLAFENNDLPGIYGAGAVQTLMNLYGVYPSKNIVMVGSGNIGLIVSYQLIQAGVNVVAVLEAAPTIGGYKVHASKLRRLGVPIYTSTTIQKAYGKQSVEGVETVQLDPFWQPIPGSQQTLSVDGVCISVGLSPIHQLLSMAEIDMKYIPELGGLVPKVNQDHETSMKHVFVCGDVIGVEEASSAIVEGGLVGLMVASSLGKPHPNHVELVTDFHDQLDALRSGPFGKKTRIGWEKIGGERNVK